MSKVEKLSIALTSELADAVRVAVESGSYATSSEVIREALRDWTDKQARKAAEIQRLSQLWDEGVSSGAAEDREPMDEFLARNRKRLADARRGQA